MSYCSFEPKIFSLTLVLACATGSALASDTSPLYPQAFLGLKAGYQSVSDNYYSTNAPRNAFGGVFAGLQFSRSWSWDLGYQYHDDLEAELTSVYLKNSVLESALRYDWYLKDDVSLYGRVGASYWDLEKTDSKNNQFEAKGFSPLGELGVNYHLTKNTRATLGYQYIDGVGNEETGQYDSHSVLLGLSYTFGRSSSHSQTVLIEKPEKDVATKSAETEIRYPEETSVQETVVQETVQKAVEIEKPKAKPTPEPKPAPLPKITINMDYGPDVEGHMKSISKKHRDDFTTIKEALSLSPEAKVLIEGHTDSIGSYGANQRLSEKRAQAIADELRRLGVDRERMIVKGKGEKEPVATNLYAPGRAQNRRVEMVVIPFSSQQKVTQK